MQTNLERQCLRRGRRAPICLTACLTACLAVLISGALPAQFDCDANALLAVGKESGASGPVKVEIRGNSECDVTGFGMAIGYDPFRLKFLGAQPGPFFEDYAGDDLNFAATAFPDEGYVVVLLLMDLKPPFGEPPPTSVAERTVLATLFFDILPGTALGKVRLRNLDSVFGQPPIAHIFTSDTVPQGIRPVLESGSIAIIAKIPFTVDAGDDQMGPENSFTTLLGSTGTVQKYAVLTYRWSQISGPPASFADDSTALFSVQLPQVDGDTPLVFKLEVDDGATSSEDTVEILALDVDARAGDFRLTPTTASRDFGAAASEIGFVGQLEWGTNLEDALWSGLRFRVTTEGEADVLDEISSATLYIDANNNGNVDAADRTLASVQNPFPGGQSDLEFSFSETLEAGSPKRFLLVVARRAPEPAQQATVFGWHAALLLAAVLILRRALHFLGSCSRRERCLSLSLVLFSLVLILSACSAGGDGGDDGSEITSSIRFSIEAAADVELRGTSTGIEGTVTGLPAQGPKLVVE